MIRTRSGGNRTSWGGLAGGRTGKCRIGTWMQPRMSAGPSPVPRRPYRAPQAEEEEKGTASDLGGVGHAPGSTAASQPRLRRFGAREG